MSADFAPINLTHHFLIAMPGLDDAAFAKSVVYLCEHSERGALGLVINKPSEILVKGLFEKVDLPLRRGSDRVDALPTGARRTVDIDAEIVGIDLDLDILSFRQHEHAGRRGVDSPLRLRCRHSLHSMHATFELQAGEGRFTWLRNAAALDSDGDVLVAAEVALLGLEHLGLPAAALGIAQVHAQQVGGEQR